MYDNLIFKANWAERYYPSRILKDFEQNLKSRIKRTIARPKCAVIDKSLIPSNKQSFKEAIAHMKMLEKCQTNYMQVILTKIDRKSKPIKKHAKICG
jgi:hypothetical protein